MAPSAPGGDRATRIATVFALAALGFGFWRPQGIDPAATPAFDFEAPPNRGGLGAKQQRSACASYVVHPLLTLKLYLHLAGDGEGGAALRSFHAARVSRQA